MNLRYLKTLNICLIDLTQICSVFTCVIFKIRTKEMGKKGEWWINSINRHRHRLIPQKWLVATNDLVSFTRYFAKVENELLHNGIARR